MKTSHLKNVVDYYSDWPDEHLPDGYYDILDELAFREQGANND